jgi:hypothetical protein
MRRAVPQRGKDVPCCVRQGVNAIAAETDTEKEIHGRARWAPAREEPSRQGSQAAECPSRLVLVVKQNHRSQPSHPSRKITVL